MYQHFIITVTAIIAALSLAAQLNYLPPAQPVEEIEWPASSTHGLLIRSVQAGTLPSRPSLARIKVPKH